MAENGALEVTLYKQEFDDVGFHNFVENTPDFSYETHTPVGAIFGITLKNIEYIVYFNYMDVTNKSMDIEIFDSELSPIGDLDDQILYNIQLVCINYFFTEFKQLIESKVNDKKDES